MKTCIFCGKGKASHWGIERKSVLGLLVKIGLSKLVNKMLFFREYNEEHFQILCPFCKSLTTLSK